VQEFTQDRAVAGDEFPAIAQMFQQHNHSPSTIEPFVKNVPATQVIARQFMFFLSADRTHAKPIRTNIGPK
jgi:hypothetical protein